MKRTFVITFLATLSILGWSQPATLFLKNGSIIKGVLEKSSDTLKVKIKSGPNLWVFSKDELLSLEVGPPKKTFEYYNITQAAVLVGESAGIQISTIHGLTYKGRYSTGVGIGVDLYRDLTLPLFIDIRADILEGYKTPFVFGSVGPNIPLSNNYQYWGYENSQPINGLFWQAGAGIKISKMYSNLMLTTAYSFSSYGFKVNSSWMPQPSTYMYYNRRILMGVSIGF